MRLKERIRAIHKEIVLLILLCIAIVPMLFFTRAMAARNRADNKYQTPAKPAPEWEGVRPRVKLSRGAQSYGGLAEERMSAAFGISAANSSNAKGRLIVADAAACARHLMRYLAHNGFLPASLVKAPPDLEEKMAAVRPPNAQATSPVFGKISLTQRAARAPRYPNDPPQRLARRPRIVQAADDQLPTNSSM